jgi:hypothetical protein
MFSKSTASLSSRGLGISLGKILFEGGIKITIPG